MLWTKWQRLQNGKGCKVAKVAKLKSYNLYFFEHFGLYHLISCLLVVIFRRSD